MQENQRLVSVTGEPGEMDILGDEPGEGRRPVIEGLVVHDKKLALSQQDKYCMIPLI